MGLGLIGLNESIDEIKTLRFWRDCLVDFAATFTLFFTILTFMADADINPVSVGLIVGEYPFLKCHLLMSSYKIGSLLLRHINLPPEKNSKGKYRVSGENIRETQVNAI